MIEPKYLRLTERVNAIDYLRRTEQFLLLVDKDPLAWKWVTIALHGALYGFAICACQGTDPDIVKWSRKRKGRVEVNLIGFEEALRRCQDGKRMYPFGQCKPLILDESKRRSLAFLKDELRDGFEHFSPKGWSIEMHGLPVVSLDALEIIRFLICESGAWMGLDHEQHQDVLGILERSSAFLRGLALFKEAEVLRTQHG